MKHVLDRIRVPLFFLIMALLAVFSPSRALRLTDDTIND